MHKHTCTETRPSTESSTRPQMSMHHTRSNQFQKYIKWILELVVQLRHRDGAEHRPCERGVCVCVEEEPDVRGQSGQLSRMNT